MKKILIIFVVICSIFFISCEKDNKDDLILGIGVVGTSNDTNNIYTVTVKGLTEFLVEISLIFFAMLKATSPLTPESISSKMNVLFITLTQLTALIASINLDNSPPLATLLSGFKGSPLLNDIIKSRVLMPFG